MVDKINDDFDQAQRVIGVWLMTLKDYPGFDQWKVKAISIAMRSGDPWYSAPEDHPTTFVFPPHIQKQHNAIMAYLGLRVTWQALADTQFYFRRYPFQNMPISMDTHFRYCCETYFSRIYEFSERLKKCLNALNEVISNNVDAGEIIKRFGQEFRDEIKERNSINHHESFDDLILQRMILEGVMALDEDHRMSDRGWKAERRRTYRKASKEWATRAIRCSARARDYLNAVSLVVTKQCTFLTDQITLGPH